MVSLAANLFLAFVIFLGGQALGASQVAFLDQPTQPEGPRLRLRAGAFDPLAAPAALAPTAQGAGPSLSLVQFAGPIQDFWLEALQACNLALVSYVPDYAYLVWGEAVAVECLERAAPLRWHGPYRPVYALHPALAAQAQANKPGKPTPTEVVIQLFETPQTPAAVRSILGQAEAVLRQPKSYLGYRTLAVRVPSDRLDSLAALPGVVNIEPMPRYLPNDEVQGQIMAGNLTADSSGPNGPGYLEWLTTMGFSTNPEEYPIVDVTDDGIDNGSPTPVHPDFYLFGDPALSDRLIYNTNWTSDATAEGLNGHGNLNASIVAGYNNRSGAPYVDGQGFHYGLGINPFGRVAGSKVFSSIWGWNLPNDDFTALVGGSYQSGARIATNSWGSASYGAYTWDDAVYDRLVRDALPAQPGNQEITILFSAGNSGSAPGTTGSPGNAKNVLTVGAAESVRPTWTDGCLVPPLGANNANDMIDFSSRGPTADGRIKPDLVAPGTHIQGAASQVNGYTGYSVCDRYQPAGQTLYAASSGTSHSTPAVAGAASLFYHYYQKRFSAQPPSPAMVKAYLTNSARYLSGVGANDTLPSTSQGYGEVHLGRAFDAALRTLLDQEVVFSESGQLFSLLVRAADPGQPVRVTLAWTDAPGVPFAAAYVNNLDLEVEAESQTFLGNVFQGAFSTPGGQVDAVNNLESVFLPAGAGGLIQVRVRASNIAGDGVPGNGDLTDQDFALVIYNGARLDGTLQGRVTDSLTGGGIAGVVVQASGESWRYRATTNPDGEYSLALPVAVYDLLAWKAGYTQESTPGVAVNENQVTVQNFRLSPVSDFLLEGCVTDQATGEGLEATISVFGPLGDPAAQTLTTRQDPCYRFRLYAATYTLTVDSLLHRPGQAQVNLVQDAVQDFALEATTLDGLLHGRVTDANTGQPLGGVLISAALASDPSTAPHQAVSDADGSYQIQLPAGDYTVSAEKRLYQTGSLSDVVVHQSNLAAADFSLRSPLLVVPLEPLRFDLLPGDRASAALTLRNAGSAPLRFSAYETSDSLPAASLEPDPYLLLDSRATAAVRYEWIDASDGIRVALPDDGEITVSLPFPWVYFGRESNLLRIGNNGAVLFGAADGDVHYDNQPLSYATDDLIAPFWDDLDADFGWVAYKTVGVAPNRRFVIEWFNRPHFFYGAEGVTFELILFEDSPNLKFQYQDVVFGDYYADRGMSATIGIRGRGAEYLEFSHNSPSLADGMALCLQALGALPCDGEDLPWMAVSPGAGLLAPGGELTLSIQVDSAPVGLGIRRGAVRLWGDDPQRQPYIDIPLVMVVHGTEWYFPFILNFPPLVYPGLR